MSESTFYEYCQRYGTHTAACDFYYNRPVPTPAPLPASDSPVLEDKALNTHSLERTNPHGEKFIGRCVYCGEENLPSSAALESCDKAPTQDLQIVNAIEGARRPLALNRFDLTLRDDETWREGFSRLATILRPYVDD